MTTQPLPTDVLHALVQGPLISYRTKCDGDDGLGVSINDFAPADQQIVKQLSTLLRALLQLLDTWQDQYAEIPQAVQTFVQQSGWWEMMQSVQQLGEATFASQTSPAFAQAVHDLKGGGLTALTMMLPMVTLGLATEKAIHGIYALTRDHLHMMGNCVRDLELLHDENGRQEYVQSGRLLAEIWDHAVYPLADHTVQVLFYYDFTGTVASSRVELAALNRALYNLINNAIYYTSDGYIYVSVMGLPNVQPRDVRFVVYNCIGVDHRQTLLQEYAMDLGALFRGGFTTGGSGLGLRICAECVATQYGLASVDRCIEAGYVGARVYDAYFVSWIHWPAA